MIELSIIQRIQRLMLQTKTKKSRKPKVTEATLHKVIESTVR